MNRLAIGAIAVVLLLAGDTRPVPAAGELSAEEIVARNEAARGGLEAWRKVETMAWIGHIETAHASVASMPFELDQKRPNRTRLQIKALTERSLRVFDGERGWKLHSGGGRPVVEPYTAQEWRAARAGHGIDGPLLDYAAKGNSVTLEGVDEIDGRKAYHLNLHLAKGGNEHVWLDTETYLEVRYDRLVDGPEGTPRRVSMTYADYRTVEGLRVPFLITTGGAPGSTPDRMQLERVLVNLSLDDASFENPLAQHGRTRLSSAPRAVPSGGPWAASPASPTVSNTARSPLSQ